MLSFLPSQNMTVKRYAVYVLAKFSRLLGRAGRFGLSDHGVVSAVDDDMLEFVQRMMKTDIRDEKYARLAPRTDELELLEGDLAQRLMTWKQLNAIPNVLRGIITSTDLEDRIELSQFLSYNDLEKLGMEKALTLVNAPVRKESREFWTECAMADLG